jgi:general secretion pathway protein K
MVLIAVLLILAVIAALVVEFHYDARISFQLAENTRTVCQTLNCAQAGLAQGDGRVRLSYGLVPAIIDWIDPDDEVTVLPFVQGQNAGVESEYYQNLEKPYVCKNGPLEVVGELMFVKGMTKEILYGESYAQKDGSIPGLETFLTVHGHGRVNINDASVVTLQTLSERVDRAVAESIVQHRPYTGLADLARVPGVTPDVLKAVQEYAAVQADDEYYTVTACGVVGKSRRTLRVVLCKDRRQGRIAPVIRWEL